MKVLFIGAIALALSGCSVSFSSSSTYSNDVFTHKNYSAENICDDLSEGNTSNCKVWRCFGNQRVLLNSDQGQNIIFDLFLYGSKNESNGAFYHEGKSTKVATNNYGKNQEWVIGDITLIADEKNDITYKLVDEVKYHSTEGHISEKSYTHHDDLVCYVTHEEQSKKILQL